MLPRLLKLLQQLALAPSFLQDEYLLLALRQAGAPVSTEKVLQLRDLCEGQSGRRHDLTRTAVAIRDHDLLILGPQLPADDFHYDVALGREDTFADFSFSAKPLGAKPEGVMLSSERAIVDGGALGSPLTVRSWQPGDWFMPLGMHGRKKLSDFFTDEKIPHERRRRIPIVESGGSIVWVCGLRLDDRVKVTPQTAEGRPLEEIPPREVGRLPFRRLHLDLVRQGLRQVVAGPWGTGRSAEVAGYPVAGKTGTSQVVGLRGETGSEDWIPWERRNHALFVCYAPADAPRIAVAVVVEHGGHGGTAAAPVARALVQAYRSLELPSEATAQKDTP